MVKMNVETGSGTGYFVGHTACIAMFLTFRLFARRNSGIKCGNGECVCSAYLML